MQIKELMAMLLPDNPNTPKIDLNAPVVSLSYDVPTEEERFEGEPIKQIILVANLQQNNTAIMPTSRVLIKLTSGALKTYQFRPEVKASKQWEVFLELSQQGAFFDNAFNGYGTKRDKLWDSKGTPETYTPEIKIFYEILHQQIANTLLKTIQSRPHLKLKAETHGIQLFSIGCGQGKDLLACFKILLSARIRCECIGLDISEKELVEAKKSNPTIFQFIQLDVTKIELLPTKVAMKPEPLKVFISSGSLTRNIMDGAYPVAQILQKMESFGAELVCISGYTHPIFNSDIGRDIGYAVSTFYSEQLSRNIFLLSKQTFEQQQRRVNLKSSHRSNTPVVTTLDLSLSSNPLRLCEAFATNENKENITQIDFSWSNLNEEEIEVLPTLLSQFPRLEQLTLSGAESWSRNFIKQIRHLDKYTITLRQDYKDPDELPTASPEVSKALGYYEHLPLKVCAEPGAKGAAATKDSFFKPEDKEKIQPVVGAAACCPRT